MLNGIEVLNESYIPNGSEYANNTFVCWILVLLITCLCIGFATLFTKYKGLIAIGIFLIIASIVGWFWIIFYKDSPSDIKKYQVTISDDVSMVEFNERYDVISVEGKIWTIVEKE